MHTRVHRRVNKWSLQVFAHHSEVRVEISQPPRGQRRTTCDELHKGLDQKHVKGNEKKKVIRGGGGGGGGGGGERKKY